MFRAFAFRSAILMVLNLWLLPAAAETPKSADEVFKLQVSLGEEDGIDLVWSIAPRHYLYRDKLSVELDGKALKPELEHGDVKDDPYFGPTEVYHDTLTAHLEGLPSTGRLTVSYQGCMENTLCYPAVYMAVDLATLKTEEIEPAEDAREGKSGKVIDSIVVGKVVPQSSDPAGIDFGSAYSIFAFLGFGLILAFTPCSFPMLPVVSAIVAGSGDSSTFRGFALSASYVLAMASAYAALGAVAGLFGANLQTLLQTPTVVFATSAVLTLFALTMLETIPLRLPSFAGRLTSATMFRRTSIPSAALLGIASTLVLSPCVTPPLASALLYATRSGSVGHSASALFAFGLGMGTPLLAVGTIGSSILPKSGAWLIRAKQIAAVILLAVALWMISRLLDGRIAGLAWGAFITCVSLFAAFAMFGRPRVGGRALPAAGFAVSILFALYGIAAAAGSVTGWSLPLKPLVWATFVSPLNDGSAQAFRVISRDVELTNALSENGTRPVLIDFSADWCSECKLMERNVFADESVKRELAGVRLIRADVTRSDSESRSMMRRFAVVGPPTLIFLNSDGVETRDARIVGSTTARDLLARIGQANRG